MYAVFLGFPLWWVLGLGGIIWPIVAVPMLLSLLRRERIIAPKGIILWLGFVGWMLATATQLDSAGRVVGFVYRGALYVSATIVLLYLFNASRETLPARKIVVVLSIFWMYVVVGGFLGILKPSFSFTSPMERVLPHSIVSNDFVKVMVHPSFAEIQDILGYPVPRPSAPFIYTNDWGGNFALLIPFVILAWSNPTIRKRFKFLLGSFAALAVIPVLISLNRGLWLSLGIGLFYAAMRLALRGKTRPLMGIVALLVFVAVMVFLTPLHQIVSDRLATPHSNNRRVSLYQEAIQGAIESPIFGYGAPRPSKWNPNAPSVGTQGAIWLVLFSHGFPGVILFSSWFLYCFWILRRSRDPVGFWVHVMLLILIIQWPVYGMIPMQVHIVMIGIALAMRERAAVKEWTPGRVVEPHSVPAALRV